MERVRRRPQPYAPDDAACRRRPDARLIGGGIARILGLCAPLQARRLPGAARRPQTPHAAPTRRRRPGHRGLAQRETRRRAATPQRQPAAARPAGGDRRRRAQRRQPRRGRRRAAGRQGARRQLRRACTSRWRSSSSMAAASTRSPASCCSSTAARTCRAARARLDALIAAQPPRPRGARLRRADAVLRPGDRACSLDLPVHRA